MAIVHLMVGLPCAGKTIWARQIEAGTGAVRLSPDAWQTRIYGNDMRHPDHTRVHDAIESIMVDLDGALLTRGVDVILDFGFLTRAERRKMRVWTEPIGAVCAMHYAAADPAVLKQRMAARAMAARSDDFVFFEGDLEA